MPQPIANGLLRPDLETRINLLPKSEDPKFDPHRLSIIFISLKLSDLPQLYAEADKNNPKREEKSFLVPLKFSVDQLTEFLFNKLEYKKYFLTTLMTEKNYLDHIEILMDSNLVAPEDGELQKFVLDPNL